MEFTHIPIHPYAKPKQYKKKKKIQQIDPVNKGNQK